MRAHESSRGLSSESESKRLTASRTVGGEVANDHILQSISIEFANALVEGSNVGALAEPEGINPSASCAFGGPDNDGDNSVFWYFLPRLCGADCTVTIDTDGSGFDTILTILDVNRNEVACNDDDPNNGAGDFSSRIEDFPLTINTPYFVRITGYDGAEGDYSFTFDGPVTGPPDDDFGTALRVVETISTYPGSNRGATGPTGTEVSASCVGGNDGDNSVWRLYDALDNNSLTIDLSGSDFDTVLMLTDVDRQELACDDDGGEGNTSRIENYPIVAGTRYFIRVTGYDGAEGIIRYGLDFDMTTAGEAEGLPTAALALEKAYPNPFTDATTLAYVLTQSSSVRLTVYDVLGREVAVLVDGARTAGSHEVRFHAAGLPSGLYVARLQSGREVQTVRLTLAR